MTTCPECLKPCPEHNVTHCATCHKHEGQCDIGDCENAATHTLVHESGRERRPVCTHHATAPHWGMIRAGYTVEKL